MTFVLRRYDDAARPHSYAASVTRYWLDHRGWPPAADTAVAAALAVFALAEVAASPAIAQWVAGPLLVVAAGALAWRRRAPLASTVVAVGLPVTGAVVAAPVDSLSVVIPILALAVYSVAAHATPRRAVAGLAFTVGAICIATFAPGGPGADNLLFGLVVALGPWLAGWAVRRRTEHAVALALRAQELERSQEARERAAVADERARIARELHDIIAHSVSVMTIQAGAVEEVLDRDPDKARAAAASIRQTGQRAQLDLRRLVGLLRADESGSQELAPQPGLAHLDELVDSVREAGLAVNVTVVGRVRPLPPAVDLSAFRLIQEALTNSLKHARATTVSVAMRYTRDAVDIEVTDDGPCVAAPRTDDPGGHGLVGMRERVALYGGTLEFGTQRGGGFRVHALFPIEAEPE